LFSNNERAVMVLEGAGDNLRSRRRSRIDENHHRRAGSECAGPRIITLNVIRGPSAPRDDLALLEEEISNVDRLVENPSAVRPQVAHRARQPTPTHRAER